MKTLAHHIGTVRAKPHHVRKQIAFALALGGTAIVALIWLVGSLAGGAFHIEDTSFAAASAPAAPVATAPQNTSLLGSALSAFSSAPSAQVEVVPQNGASAPAPAPSQSDTQTVIPF